MTDIPRLGRPREPGRHYRRRPGAYAILLRDGLVLLTHQAEPLPEWQLPGGGIDPGETAQRALHREVFEETGWHIGTPRRVGTYRRFTFMPEYDLWAEKVCHIFLARPTLCLGAPTEPGHEAAWATPRAALAMLATDGDRAMLRAVLGLQVA